MNFEPNPSVIRFHHFSSKESYCELQKNFARYCYRDKYKFDEFKEPVESLKIIEYVQDEFTGKEEYLKRDFEVDFLFKGVVLLSDYYFKVFRETIEKKAIYAEEALRGYTINRLSKIREWRDKIFAMNIYSLEIKTSVIKQTYILEELIGEYLKNPFPQYSEKIKFNWNRSDVIVFFHLLRSNKAIEQISDADLGKIIDAIFEYKKDDGYSPITTSRKHLSEYNRSIESSSGRSIETPLKRIQKIFTDEDFYSI